MYTKEDIKKILPEFAKSKFSQPFDFNGRTSLEWKYLREALEIWPGLFARPRVLRHWVNHYKEENFIDSLFCENCGKFMNERWEWQPKYCCPECRKANHNWKKGTAARKALEDMWEEKYGCRNPLGAKEVRDKVKQTNLERYGAEHNWGKGSTVWETIKETNRQKYGTDYVVQSDYFKEKAKETCLEHYGEEHPMWSEEVKAKVRQTCMERYGVPNVRCKGSPVLEKLKQICLEKYGVPYFCQTEQCKQAANALISETNKYIHNRLKELGIETEYEKQVGWYRYDLYLGDNVLLDINPSYTHSAIVTDGRFKPKPKEYHYMRLKNAVVNGYTLIQLWDWDNWDKVISSLAKRELIYARKCELKEVSTKDANEFLQKYHFQNSCQGQTVCLGLYHENELIELMTFGIPRYNKNYQWELLRLCTKFGYTVVGGASRLLKHFEQEYIPQSLLSYCDLSKFSGKVYEELGFKDIGMSISKHWSNCTEDFHFTDNLLRQLGADKLLGTEYGKGTSNEEIMKLHNYIPVYDAGQKTYLKEYKV